MPRSAHWHKIAIMLPCPTFTYYSDLALPSNAIAALQVIRTVAALQQSGRDARLFIPIPWRYGAQSAQQRLARLRAYYGLDDSFCTREVRSPVPLVAKLQRIPLTCRALGAIRREDYGLLCVRNYWHLKMGLSRGMRVLYETYKYRVEPERTRHIVQLLNQHRHFVGLILHSDLARQHWLSLGAPPDKAATIHNGVNQADIASGVYAGQSEARHSLMIPPDAKVIVYTGNMGRHKGVEALLDLACHLPEFDFQLVGCRERGDRVRLTRRARELALANVTLRDWLPPSEVAPFLRAADAVIIPPSAAPLRGAGRTVLPYKTFQYLASGAPLLAPRLEDTAELLRHGENAFLLCPDAPRQNAEAIRGLWATPGLRERLAAAALRQMRECTWARRADRIADFAAANLARLAGGP